MYRLIHVRYDQQQMRKLMMKSYEGTEALERRRKQARYPSGRVSTIDLSRSLRGDKKRPGGASVAAGRAM